MLTVIDEFTRECLGIDVGRRLNSQNVLAVLADLMIRRGVSDNIRSDNGPEFAAIAVRQWIAKVGAATLLMEPGSPSQRLRAIAERAVLERTATMRASTASCVMNS